MPDLTPEQWLTLLIATATLLTAIATFWNVRELSKQRAASMRPELLFRPTRWACERAGAFSSKNFVNIGEVGDAEEDIARHMSISTKIVNVGLGASKEIKVHWSFDVEKTVAELNPALQLALEDFHLHKEDSLIFAKIRDEPEEVVGGITYRIEQIDVITSSAEDVATVNLPVFYSTIQSLALALSADEKFEISKLPNFYATVEYHDIAGKVYTKHLVAEIRSNSVQVGVPLRQRRVHFELSWKKADRSDLRRMFGEALKEAFKLAFSIALPVPVPRR